MKKLRETKRKQNLKDNQQGQALLFVVVAMTIALTIGINASVRTISSLSRTSRTDTAARALAAAEGGIERYLALSTPQLEDAISGTCPVGHWSDESAACIISFDVSGDILTSQAFVNVERYTPSFYPFELTSGQVKEVNLYDFNASAYYPQSTIEICWNSNPDSDLMYLSYNRSDVQERGGIYGVVNTPGAPYAREGFSSAIAGHDGYDSCSTVDIGSNIYGLRIRSVGGDSSVAIFPTGGADLPLQGYTITSVGRIEQDQGVTATRTIKIVRTLPYLPVSFDYALYSESPIIK